MNKGTSLTWLRGLATALFCAALLPLLGCGGGGGTGTVSGKVTYRDKPLPGGYITFVPEKGSSVARGDIEKDGSYRVEKVPVGPVKIAVQALEPPKYAAGNMSPAEVAKMGKKAFQRAAPAPRMKLPENFTDPEESGLTYTVKKGMQEYNIPLK